MQLNLSLLNADEVEINLNPKLYKEQNISTSNLTDEIVNYISIELTLQFVQLTKSSMVFDSVYVNCTIN